MSRSCSTEINPVLGDVFLARLDPFLYPLIYVFFYKFPKGAGSWNMLKLDFT
jgi:hypothetical protein